MRQKEGVMRKGRGNEKDTSGEKQKEKSRSPLLAFTLCRIALRRVAPSRFYRGFRNERARGVRRGCANRCAGPFPQVGSEEPAERAVIPLSVRRAQLSNGRLAAIPFLPCRGLCAVLPRRTIRLERGAPANGGTR